MEDLTQGGGNHQQGLPLPADPVVKIIAFRGHTGGVDSD